MVNQLVTASTGVYLISHSDIHPTGLSTGPLVWVSVTVVPVNLTLTRSTHSKVQLNDDCGSFLSFSAVLLELTLVTVHSFHRGTSPRLYSDFSSEAGTRDLTSYVSVGSGWKSIFLSLFTV